MPAFQTSFSPPCLVVIMVEAAIQRSKGNAEGNILCEAAHSSCTAVCGGAGGHAVAVKQKDSGMSLVCSLFPQCMDMS